MDSETQALIDQLRDRMADMPHSKRIQMIEILGDGYFDFRKTYKALTQHQLLLAPVGELIHE